MIHLKYAEAQSNEANEETAEAAEQEGSTGIPGVLGKIQERKIVQTPIAPQQFTNGQSFPKAVHRKLSKVNQSRPNSTSLMCMREPTNLHDLVWRWNLMSDLAFSA